MKYSIGSNLQKVNFIEKSNKSESNFLNNSVEEYTYFVKPKSKNILNKITLTEEYNLKNSRNIKSNSFYFSILSKQTNLAKLDVKSKLRKSIKYDADFKYLPRVEIPDQVEIYKKEKNNLFKCFPNFEEIQKFQ